MKTIQDIPLPKLRDLFSVPKAWDYSPLILTGSGKSSISLILKYLRQKKIFQDKTQEILVPKWIGYWVYNQINEHCFPTSVVTENTKAVLLYHQFGIPQYERRWQTFLQSKDLVVIEDCAHMLRLPTEGTKYQFSIFSFSKFFFCFALGGIISNDKEFIKFAKTDQKKSPYWKMILINIVKFWSEKARSKGSLSQNSLSISFLNATYSWCGSSSRFAYVSEKLFQKKFLVEYELRTTRFNKLKDVFTSSGRIDYLQGVIAAPYAFPIHVKNEEGVRLVQRLRTIGIHTGIYTFDCNRFYLEPDYKKVILLYLHSEIPESIFNDQVQICKEELK